MEHLQKKPQFIKLLDAQDCNENSLAIPTKFTVSFGMAINESVKLLLRSGYVTRVNYLRQASKFVGVQQLFREFALNGGEILVFEFRNPGTFSLYIMGRDGAEVFYPNISQDPGESSNSSRVTTPSSWKFVKCVKITERIVHEVMLPTSFMTMVARKIPNIVTFLLNNGMEFLGYCSNGHGKFYGLQAILEGVGLDDFRAFSYIVFTYDMSSIVRCSFFDGRNVEVILHESPLEKHTLLASITLPKYFAIEVKPSNMLPYCYGVDIPVEYRKFTNMWRTKEQIMVVEGSRSWELEVRKRSNRKRTTILRGWIEFRNGMHLDVGDRCVFKWKDECVRRFTIEVVKAVYEVDSD